MPCSTKNTLHANIRLYILLFSIASGIIVSVVIHEIGHSVVCSYFGYDSPITINITESSALCKETGMERDYVRLAGGGFAAILFLLVLAPSAIRRNDYAKLSLMSGGIAQLFNAVWETFFNASYDSDARIIMLIVTVVIIIVLKRRMFISQENLNNLKKRLWLLR